MLPIGQSCKLQGCDADSMLVALQFRPPFLGAGLEQVLVCDWFPPPHVRLQVLHWDQSDQFPSETILNKIKYLFCKALPLKTVFKTSYILGRQFKHPVGKCCFSVVIFLFQYQNLK